MNNISPYPEHVVIKGDRVFNNGRYVGYIDKISNWGTDFLARSEYPEEKPNKFFPTKTEAVKYLCGL